MKEGNIPYLIDVVPDGPRALAYLKQEEEFANAPRPDLILLDFDLPGLNGDQILQLIKTDDALKAIPVIIFTTLGSEVIQRRAYQNCANSFVIKPLDFSKFIETVQSIAAYWFTTCGIEARV